MLPLKGLPKLAEECGELVAATMKKLAYWQEKYHPDDGYLLKAEIEKEVGDVLAAIAYATDRYGLNRHRIEARKQQKLTRWERKKLKFKGWNILQPNAKAAEAWKKSMTKRRNRLRQNAEKKIEAT